MRVGPPGFVPVLLLTLEVSFCCFALRDAEHGELGSWEEKHERALRLHHEGRTDEANMLFSVLFTEINAEKDRPTTLAADQAKEDKLYREFSDFQQTGVILASVDDKPISDTDARVAAGVTGNQYASGQLPSKHVLAAWLFDWGAVLQGLGNVVEAAEKYNEAILLHRELAPAWLNIAALHHRYGSLEDAERNYKILLSLPTLDKEMEAMAMINLAICYEQQGKVTEALETYRAALKREKYMDECVQKYISEGYLQSNWGSASDLAGTLGTNEENPALGPNAESLNHSIEPEPDRSVKYSQTAAELQTCPEYTEVQWNNVLPLLTHRLRAEKTLCLWENWDQKLSFLLKLTEKEELGRGLPSSLLPFDSLSTPFHTKTKRRIAEAYSRQYSHLSGSFERDFQAHLQMRADRDQETLLGLQTDTQKDENEDKEGQHTYENGEEQARSERRTRSTSADDSDSASQSYVRDSDRENVWTQPPVRVGYLSFDFNQHPTAHLMEGLFVYHDRERTHSFALSYGKDDQSEYRKSIVENSDKFLDLALLGHRRAAETIFEHEIQILMDAQGHTRGGRPEIAAFRPAPIVVNYLVYAGTSGAQYVDYFISDKHVSPPETVDQFTEKLVLMPCSYQINYYTDHGAGNPEEFCNSSTAFGSRSRYSYSSKNKNSKTDNQDTSSNSNNDDKKSNSNDNYNNSNNAAPAAADDDTNTNKSDKNDYLEDDDTAINTNSIDGSRRAEKGSRECHHLNFVLAKSTRFSERKEAGLPVDGFVFANFNKNDKLEPEVFTVWMNILRRVPGSVLWLLQPQASPSFQKIKATLSHEAAKRGIEPTRLVFAKRVSKAEHLQRHWLADLFIDTFIYGAHSTATDALWGGLPVLTLAGESFASRVGASLLENIDLGPLVTHTINEFEDLAVFLAENPSVIRALRRKTEEARGRFDPVCKDSIQGAERSAPSTRHRAPLFDTESYTNRLEAAYRVMWDLHLLGRGPMHIIVGQESNGRHESSKHEE